jgi:hypothetical protein
MKSSGSLKAQDGSAHPSQRFLDELAAWKPGQRVELLSRFLITETVRMFGIEFFSLEIRVVNGAATDIRLLLNIKPIEMGKRG